MRRLPLSAVFGLLLALPGSVFAGFLQNLEGASANLPQWMTGPPIAQPSLRATVSFPIQPPVAEDDLLVTIFFTEQRGGFLRVFWDDGFNKQMLCENLLEGIAMENRRTLVIKRSTLIGKGLLTFQSSGAKLGINRIYWDWNRPQAAYLDEAFFSGGLLGRSGEWLRDDEIDGLPSTERNDFWQGEALTAPISTTPVRIESGIKFVAEVPEKAARAMIHVKISGLPLKEKLALWINAQLAGEIVVPYPNLSDPGLSETASGGLVYTGWQEGTLLVEANLLKVGENSFQFQPESDQQALAVKNFDLQIRYSPTETPPKMHSRLSFRSHRRSAFTLIEIILVLSIIAILMGAVIYNISGNLDDAKIITARTGIQSITTSLKRYEMSNLNAPTTEQGLQALVTLPGGSPKPRSWMQLLKELPMDPWGEPFKYSNPGTHNTTGYDVYSMGPDKKEGTPDDVGNWSDAK